MVTIQDTFGAFFVAVIVSYGFTPLARQIAFKTKLLDHADSKKSHVPIVKRYERAHSIR